MSKTSYGNTQQTGEPQESNMPTQVYVLCEEHEDDNGIIDFNLLAVSHSEDALKSLLLAKVEKDEYGLIAANGVWDSSDNHFETNFEGSCVKYYILNQDLLSKEQALALLDTKEFETTFRHPHNLKDILRAQLADIMEGEGFLAYNADIAADYIMADKKFQSVVKQCWWGNHSQLQGDDIRFAETELGVYLTNKLCEDQDWFVTIGAAERPHYPSNLIDIVINAVYDIAKEYQLPVHDAKKTAELIMRRNDFKSTFEGFRNTEYLSMESPEYEHAVRLCDQFMESAAVREEIEPRKVNFDFLLDNAIRRQNTQTQIQPHSPDRDRT